MTYEAFKEVVKANIKNFLPNSYRDAEVSIVESTKENDVKVDLLSITRPGEAVVPAIRVKEIYREFGGRPEYLEDALNTIASMHLNASAEGYEMGRRFQEIIRDREKLLNAVEARLINAKQSGAFLEQNPHTFQDGLMVVYHISGKLDPETNLQVPITHDIAKLTGVSSEELHEAAMRNMVEKNPATLEKAPFFKFYILTNEEANYGAVTLLYPGIMERVAEEVGGDFVAIPSSVHEFLVIPPSVFHSMEDLADYCKNSIASVNETLKPQEVLDDKAFYYDSEEKKLLSLDEKMEMERNREKSGMSKESKSEIQQFLDKESAKEKDINSDKEKDQGMEL